MHKTLLVFGLTLMTPPAVAQQQIDAKKDWSVFESGKGKTRQCWIVSTPTAKKATRGGKPADVKRGDIFLMIAVRPAKSIKNEVSFLGGYPFKKGSTVTVKIGSNSFSLFTENETAWALSTEDDNRLVAAMRRGAKARIEGTSTRGTRTFDTFSLSGFTAALKRARQQCK